LRLEVSTDCLEEVIKMMKTESLYSNKAIFFRLTRCRRNL
jgi:hypothetical protein